MNLSDDALGTWERDPAAPILEFRGSVYTRGDLAGWAEQFEALLKAAGVPIDAPISMVSRNRPLIAVIMAAAVVKKLSLSSHYSMQSPEQLAAEIRSMRPPVLVADSQDWTKPVLAAAREVGSVGITLDLAADSPIAFAPGLDRPGEGPFREPLPSAGIEILSSGTTGPPKRVLLKLDQMSRFVDMVKTTTPPGEEPSAVLLMYPLSSVGGAGSIVPNLLLGRYVALFEKFTVESWVEAVERLKPKSFVVPPTVLQMIIDAKVPVEAMSSVKYIYGGGARLAPELQTEFEDIYSVKVLWAYGATEFCGTLASWSPDLYEQFDKTKRGAVGRIVPGIQARTVDVETGLPQPVNSEGYLEALIPEISDDWIHTTDIVRIDEDGFIFHLGRGDGAIVRGGFKVLPESIIAVLKQYPLVRDVGIVGLPDQRLGQVPVAVIEASPGEEPDMADLEAFARKHLLTHQVPARFMVVNELPKNGTMKIDQRALSDLVERHFGQRLVQQEPAPAGETERGR